MLIQRIKISNYKTYLSLDLDLTVDDDRPIILIGGANGGGKTTLFEAISGALYGLKIENKEHFMELLNQGALNTAKPEISLQITFVGKVLGQQQKYILKRVYQLNPQGKPLESVSLNMNGNMYVYGTMTAPKDRVKAEQEINKIIKANLPQELSQYFLFDAMQSSELLKKNVFAQTIRDNFENVLGFKKYLQLKRAAEKLQQEWAQQRLEAEKEAQEYNELCAQKDKLTADLNTCIAEQDTKYKYLASVEVEYKRAKDGAQEASALNKKIQELASKIDDIVKRAATYAEDLKAFVDNIEIDLFLPKLASNLAQEINNILHIKEQLQKENTGAYPLETLKDVTNKIITYLKDLSLCSESVDEEQVVSHIVAIQNSTNKEDPFGYLDEAEVTALSNLVKRTGSNQFIALDRQRQELEIQLSTLDNLRSQKQTLEQTQAGGNEYLIQNYEAAQKQIEKLKSQEATLKADIQRLEKRIHQFDVQIQQEPDIKFDTLVKLKPLFEKIADSLLKKKKAQIESEMQQQLNKLLVSYKGHVAKVELSDSIEQFEDCSGLTSISFGNGVEDIGDDSFNATGFITLDIPDNVKRIGISTFGNCHQLKSLTLGRGLETIEDGAFESCEDLEEIRCKSLIPPKAYLRSFKSYLITLFVPTEAKRDYESTAPWFNFVDIRGWDFGGVNSIEKGTVNAFVSNNTVVVNGANVGDLLEVYDVAGRLVYSGTDTTISVPTKVIYIVRVAGQTFKVAL